MRLTFHLPSFLPVAQFALDSSQMVSAKATMCRVPDARSSYNVISRFRTENFRQSFYAPANEFSAFLLPRQLYSTRNEMFVQVHKSNKTYKQFSSNIILIALIRIISPFGLFRGNSKCFTTFFVSNLKKKETEQNNLKL